MKVLYYIILIVDIVWYLIFILDSIPKRFPTKRCPKCKKNIAYPSDYFYKGSKTCYKNVKKEKIVTDKYGNKIKEITNSSQPYEKKQYDIIYKCDSCNFLTDYPCIKSLPKKYNNYDEFKNKKMMNYIISSSIFGIIFIIFFILILV